MNITTGEALLFAVLVLSFGAAAVQRVAGAIQARAFAALLDRATKRGDEAVELREADRVAYSRQIERARADYHRQLHRAQVLQRKAVEDLQRETIEAVEGSADAERDLAEEIRQLAAGNLK